MHKLLIAGGDQDPNLQSLAVAAVAAGVGVVDLRQRPDESPGFFWDLARGVSMLEGGPLEPTSAFIRYDVFASMTDSRPAVAHRAGAWHDTLMGWLFANPDVRLLNRDMSPRAGNKPLQLVTAKSVGLRVPETRITNELSRCLDAPGGRIAKPVSGGDYCRLLDDVARETVLRRGNAAAPAIVQNRVPAPEVRIYVIGDATLAFELHSDALDYRIDDQVEVRPRVDIPLEADGLRQLMMRLGMDFGAADFRTDPETGALTFLELNTSPMFARFDAVAGGRLCAAMVAALTDQAGAA